MRMRKKKNSESRLGLCSELLLESREEIKEFPDDYVIYPGHGESSTIGYEKRNNIYCFSNMSISAGNICFFLETTPGRNALLFSNLTFE